ncbi:hypothetical protein L211DRAFT_835505, partial [Terfezia boudieri ATCC MYA-4762]
MYLYYLSVITILLVMLSRHVVKTTITTTTTTTTTTITTTITTVKATITTVLSTTTMTTTTYRGASIDLDAVLQRSIDCQVLAEIKAERVLQYFIKQSKYQLVKYQPATHQLCSQPPPFLIKERVRWDNRWIDCNLDLITETSDSVLDTIPDSECSWGTGIRGG